MNYLMNWVRYQRVDRARCRTVVPPRTHLSLTFRKHLVVLIIGGKNIYEIIDLCLSALRRAVSQGGRWMESALIHILQLLPEEVHFSNEGKV